MKGVGEIYPETKKVISVGVTAVAIEGLNAIALVYGNIAFRTNRTNRERIAKGGQM